MISVQDSSSNCFLLPADMESAPEHSQCPVDETSLYFQANLSLFKIARYYDIHTLKTLQVRKMRSLLARTSWTPEGFIVAALQILGEGVQLEDALIQIGVRHAPELTKAGVFSSFTHYPDFLVGLINASGQELDGSRTELAQLRQCVQSVNKSPHCRLCKKEEVSGFIIKSASGEYIVSCKWCRIGQLWN